MKDECWIKDFCQCCVNDILIGIENCTFANAKDGRFASDPASATIEN